MGRREGRPGWHLWCAMVRLENVRRALNQPARTIDCRYSEEPGQPATDRDRLESGRDPGDEIASVPRDVSILRGRWEAKLSALPTKCRLVSRRAIQYRFLRVADAYDRCGLWTRLWRIHSHVRRRAYLSKPSGSSTRAIGPHSATASRVESQAGTIPNSGVRI